MTCVLLGQFPPQSCLDSMCRNDNNAPDQVPGISFDVYSVYERCRQARYLVDFVSESCGITRASSVFPKHFTNTNMLNFLTEIRGEEGGGGVPTDL